eukprot:6492450-Amphidinium_carterae.3
MPSTYGTSYALLSSARLRKPTTATTHQDKCTYSFEHDFLDRNYITDTQSRNMTATTILNQPLNISTSVNPNTEATTLHKGFNKPATSYAEDSHIMQSKHARTRTHLAHLWRHSSSIISSSLAAAYIQLSFPSPGRHLYEHH